MSGGAPEAAHCQRCGAALAPARPPGDDHERLICGRCGWVFYDNPRVVVGTLVAVGDAVLLCRRAIAPREGLWTLPAGFLERGESATAGAGRETLEEAGARVRVTAPLAHFDIPDIGQIYLLFRAELLAPGLAPGPESLEVRLFPRDALPWGELAFDAVRFALERWLADRDAQAARVHYGVLTRPETGPPSGAAAAEGADPWVPCRLDAAWSLPLGLVAP